MHRKEYKGIFQKVISGGIDESILPLLYLGEHIISRRASVLFVEMDCDKMRYMNMAMYE